MCTSNALKPARSNADAISTWLLTPCSRRIATCGRAPVVDVRRGDVLGRIERQLRLQARRVEAARGGALLVGALGVVAQLLHRVRDRPPGVEQLVPAPFGQRLAVVAGRGSTGAVVGRAMRCAQSIRPWRATRSANSARSSRGDLHDRAEFLVEQRAERILAPAVEGDVQAEVRAERHLAQRRERAAVGTVVVGQQQAGLARVADQFEERAQALRIVEVRHAGPAERRQRGSRRRRRRPADGTAPGSSRPGAACRRPGRSATAPLSTSRASSGVSCWRTSATGANARDDQRHRRHRLLRGAVGRATAPASTANPCRPGCSGRAPGTVPCRPP